MSSHAGDDVLDSEQYILALDVGTTSVRAHIYNQQTRIIGESAELIQLISLQPGHSEIDPEQLWRATCSVIRNVLKKSNLTAKDIAALGMSCQRNTFTVWNRNTGRPYHNLITWKDLRAESACSYWNRSYYLKALRSASKCLYWVTRSKRFLAASILKLQPAMVLCRLEWMLDIRYPEIRSDPDAIYGTIDTWLIWKLTDGRVHATDPGQAGVSGFFDPFVMDWSEWALRLFHIPAQLLPEVRDTNGDFGMVKADLFGSEIPIRSAVGDQQAAMFGECCFNPGDIKVTLGTGSFLNINTGTVAHSSFTGVYPVVGWRLYDCPRPIYLVECSSADTGTTIEWAKRFGLFGDPSETVDLARSVDDSGGLYFVPSFSGMHAPYNDPSAAAGLIGMKPSTRPEHVVRAILESIGFRVRQVFDIVKFELTQFKHQHIRVDGGVASNDFVVELIANLTGTRVTRDHHHEMSSLGAATMAGLSVGYWTSFDQLTQMRKKRDEFSANATMNKGLDKEYRNWKRAVNRCLNWNATDEIK